MRHPALYARTGRRVPRSMVLSDGNNVPPARDDESSYELRCAGLPYLRDEPLDPSARQCLVRRGRRQYMLAFLYALTLPVLFLPEVAALVVRGDREGMGWTAFLTVYFLFWSLAVLPVLLVLVPNALRRGRILRRGGRAGYVRRFAGTVNWNDSTDLDLARLVRAGLVQPGIDEATVDLHPRDDFVYAVDGVVLSRWIPIEATLTASRPEAPLELDVPASWMPEGARVPMERRRLTSAEKDEIQGYARVLKRATRLILMTLLLLPLLAVGATALERFGIDPRLAVAAMAIAGGLIALRHILRIRRQFRLFAQDVDLGWVIIVRPRDTARRAPTPGNADAIDSLRVVTTEFLPVSGAVWTVDGRPAGWRRSRSEEVRA